MERGAGIAETNMCSFTCVNWTLNVHSVGGRVKRGHK